MAKASANVVYNNFTGGLITEASPLNFPENAAQTIDNVLLSRDGRIKRRLGIDYEAGYAITDTSKTSVTFDDHAVAAFRWDNVGNDATVSVGVIQIGNELWFTDLYATSPSATLLNGGVSIRLNSSTVGTDINGNEIISFAPALGVLVFASKEMESPYYLEYDATLDTFSTTKVDIEVRDFWGVDDGLEVNERPTSLSIEHEYNLKNQGWPDANITAVAYPSNAEVWTLGKDSSDVFQSSLLLKQDFGNTPAPKGRYILDAFNRGDSRVALSGVVGLSNDEETGRLSAVGFYASRIWYSGVESSVTDGGETSPDYTGYLFFSQILKSKADLGKCYQSADPTSEHDSLLVASDGGFVVIPEASRIYRVEPVQDRLVIFAENGIWEVRGSDSTFAADDFQVGKISNLGVTNARAVVNAEGQIFYWSKGGIYALVPDANTYTLSGGFKPQNVSESTVQSYYLDIPSVGKANAEGFYDVGSRQIRWLYNDSDSYTGVTLKNKYNRELVLDLTLSAFSTITINELDAESPFVAGYLSTPNFLTVSETQIVVAGEDVVQVGAEDVVIISSVRGRGVSTRKYLTIVPSATTYSFTLSNYNNTSFLDWEAKDAVGVDAAGVLETGDTTFGDIMRNKQITYLVAHFDRTETEFVDNAGVIELDKPSGCLIQARWSFSDSGNSGKYGTPFQAYRFNRNFVSGGAATPFDYGHSVITTKNKIRGRGKAIRFRITTEAGKDLQLIGWAINVTGITNV